MTQSGRYVLLIVWQNCRELSEPIKMGAICYLFLQVRDFNSVTETTEIYTIKMALYAFDAYDFPGTP